MAVRRSSCRFAAPLFALALAGLSTAGAIDASSPAPEIPSDWPEDELEAPEGVESRPTAGGVIHTVGGDSACDYPDLSAALSAAADGDTIRLTNSGDYSGQTYLIRNFDGELTIRGGYFHCQSVEPVTRTVLDAGATGRVFYIEQGGAFSGSKMAITLENLEIVNGDTSGSFGGGGLLINGQPGVLDVRLKNVYVMNNHSDARGGGIHLRLNTDRQGDGTMLTLDNESRIQDNTSDSHGGGMACSSLGYSLNARTLLRLGAATVSGNSAGDGGANGHGGGVYLDGCKRVFMYGGGTANPLKGAIYVNTASGNGGGIAVKGGAVVSVRGDSVGAFGDPAVAAEIYSNEAASGGGVWVADDGSSLSLGDVLLQYNNAQFVGGGAYVSNGGFLGMRRLHGQPCQAAGGGNTERCSWIVGNEASVGGAALDVQTAGEVEVVRTKITGHSGFTGRLISIDSNMSSVTEPVKAFFEGLLIHGNSGVPGAPTTTIFTANNDAVLTVGWSTITDNDVANVARTGSGNADISIYASIIHEDSGAIVERAGQGTVAARLDCVIGHQDYGDLDVDSAGYYSRIDPGFVAPSGNDFHLADNSPAIDYCNAFNAPQYPGLNGNVRGTPHQGPPLIDPPVRVTDGEYDLGAYEMNYVLDEVFNDRFEN